MTNKTLSGQKSKDKLLEGVNIINDAVSSTLGPSGKNVLIETEDNTVRITKDGVTVANALKKLSDPIANMGLQLIKQVANKSADKAGDGTTTSTLLASVIVKEGLKSIVQGRNPIEVKKGIDKAVKIVVKHLKVISKDISSEEQIKQVATLSANNDAEIGNIIAKALDQAGPDGIVTIEESKTGETYLETVEGMSLDRGYKSPYFVTDNTTMQSILEKPRILIFDGNITQGKELVPFLQFTSAKGEPLVIIAHDVDGEALATVLVNKAQGTIKALAVKAPQFAERRTHILHDIAILTGGEVLSPEFAGKLDKFPQGEMNRVLGTARLITAGRDFTTIIDGKGDHKLIETRLIELKAQIDNAKTPYEVEMLQSRLAKMIGGVSIIHVGANSEVELKERKDRVDDALHATKAAIEEGVLPGGGMALLTAADSIDEEFISENADQDLGFEIVKKAICAPFIKILENAGIDNHYKILSNIQSNNNDPEREFNQDLTYHAGWEGYNVKTGNYENFLETGVLDPTKVTRTAIENAASVAGIILTTESVVYLEKEKESSKEDDVDLSQFM